MKWLAFLSHRLTQAVSKSAKQMGFESCVDRVQLDRPESRASVTDSVRIVLAKIDDPPPGPDPSLLTYRQREIFSLAGMLLPDVSPRNIGMILDAARKAPGQADVKASALLAALTVELPGIRAERAALRAERKAQRDEILASLMLKLADAPSAQKRKVKLDIKKARADWAPGGSQNPITSPLITLGIEGDFLRVGNFRLPAETGASAGPVRLNIEYLLDFARSIPADALVRVRIGKVQTPVSFLTGELDYYQMAVNR